MIAKSWPEIESKVAELERENAELITSFNELNREYAEDIEKQNVSLSVINIKAEQLKQENVELTQALERACEMIVKATAANKGSTGCRVCPLFVPGRACIWFLKQGVNGCAEGLVKYFKEAAQ